MKNTITTLPRFKQTLNITTLHDNVGDKVFPDEVVVSYGTTVAKIDHAKGTVNKIAWRTEGNRTTSPTTSKHINYVAEHLSYDVVEVA
tara:strand:- start:261 stop:524 length:264 start_codon:yes stop_codon:yes gene_type:complete